MNQRRIELLQEAVAMILASDDLAAAADIAARANAELRSITDPIDLDDTGAVGSGPTESD